MNATTTEKPEPYSVRTLELGQLGELFEVRSAMMPRQDFVEMVDEALMDYDNLSNQTKEELRETAATMPRFPIGTWINPKRGCGCVIGEYLVARSEIERAAYIEDAKIGSVIDVRRMLRDRDDGWALESFGIRIDRAVRERLGERALQCANYELANRPDIVSSVEFID